MYIYLIALIYNIICCNEYRFFCHFNRFIRHFNVLCMPPASELALASIFEQILGGFLVKFEPDVQKLCKGAVAATIEVYKSISMELLPTPSKFHYTFNLRDISKVFQGILMIR